MADSLRQDILDLQDIEKIQYGSTDAPLRARELTNSLINTKNNAFTKVSGDMARFMDMDHNSQSVYSDRSNVLNTYKQISTEQSKIIDSKKFNEDLTRRQSEINEWYYENKRETLFVLQLILLTSLTVVILLAVKSYGWIGQAAADYVTVFILVVAAATWVYRWYYTTHIRDRKYWNKRTFKAGEVPDSSECPAEVVSGAD